MVGSADSTEEALDAVEGVLRDLAGARLECERLRVEVRTANTAWDSLFGMLPVACVLTDGGGFILDANRPAGAVLNLSPKRLRDRELVLFSEDRCAFGALLRRLAGADSEFRATVRVRPRERRPATQVLVMPVVGRPGFWLWFLTPSVNDDGVASSESSPGDSPPAAS